MAVPRLTICGDKRERRRRKDRSAEAETPQTLRGDVNVLLVKLSYLRGLKIQDMKMKPALQPTIGFGGAS